MKSATGAARARWRERTSPTTREEAPDRRRGRPSRDGDARVRAPPVRRPVVPEASLAVRPATTPPRRWRRRWHAAPRSEEHTSELQSHSDLVCRLLLEKKKKTTTVHALLCATSRSCNKTRAR